MPTLGALALATAMLIDTRWILNEELGILGRSESDAAKDLLDDALATLNQSSDELAEIAFELGASPAHPEALADALTREVLGRARTFLRTSGEATAELFFFTACALVLRQLTARAHSEQTDDTSEAPDAKALSTVAAGLTRALEKRLTSEPTHRSAVAAAAEELVPVWQNLAERISC